MKKMKALSLLLAAALTVSSVAVNDTTADAAKKPKLSKTKVSIAVGSTYKIKVKNGAKKAKVTWTTSNKKIVKIAKKNSKGKTAYAQVKGLKKGKATIKASYKLGKSKAKVLRCTVTVTKKKATATTAPTQAATNAPATATATPVITNAPQQTTAPESTVKPTKTPKPTATVKPSAEPWENLDADVIDVLKCTYLDVADGVKATTNADGSVTLDYSGTSYKGARWYFGSAEGEGEERVTTQKPINLENYSYVVVEGVNQEGLTADEEGKMHDLNAQFLDALDKAEHGGELEIDTQSNIAFPIKFELTDATKRTNVVAFEIYSLGSAESAKAGPITVKSVKIYKDKATYEKLTGSTDPQPSAVPTPDPAKSVKLDLSKADTTKCDEAVVGEDGSLKITAKSDALGKDAVINIPEEIIAKQYTKMYIEYSDVEGTFSFKYRAQDETKRPKDWDGYDWAYQDAKYLLPATSNVKVVTFREDAVPVDQVVFFNVQTKGTITIKSVTFTDPKNDETVQPSATPSTEPSATPSTEPSATPSTEPSATPSTEPSATPSTSPSTEPSATPTASPTAIPAYDDTNAVTGDAMAVISEGKVVNGGAAAYKVATPIVADGTIDDVWADVPAYAFISAYEDQAAMAKVAWDNNNLYVIVRVKDAKIVDSLEEDDWGNMVDYKRDGGELFLNEDNSAGNTYDRNLDAFQYRFTGFTSDTSTSAITAGCDNAKALYSGIVADYKFTGDGYIMEYMVPWADAANIKAGKDVGFELHVFDCADGDRRQEMGLLTTASDLYKDPSHFGTLTLYSADEPDAGIVKEPEVNTEFEPYELDLSKGLNTGDAGTVSFEEGLLNFNAVDGVYIPLGNVYKNGDSINVTITGASDKPIRSYVGPALSGNSTEVYNPTPINEKYTLVLKDDVCNQPTDGGKGPYLLIKKVGWNDSDRITGSISKITVQKVDPTAPVEIKGTTVDLEAAKEHKVSWNPSDNEIDYGVFNNTDTVTHNEYLWGQDAVKFYNLTDVMGDMVIKVPTDALYTSVEVEYSDYTVAQGEITKGIGIKYVIEGDDESDPWHGHAIQQFPEEASGKFTINFDAEHLGKITKLKISNTKSDSKITLKSITFKKEAVTGTKSNIPTAAEKIALSGTIDGKEVSEDIDLAGMDLFVEQNSDMFTTLTKMAGKESGSIEKTYGDNTTVYTPSGAGKGVLSMNNGETKATVEIKTPAEGKVKATFDVDEKNIYVVEVDQADPGKLTITKDNTSGYEINIVESESGYTMTYTTASGEVVKIDKNSGAYSLIASGAVSAGYYK